MKLCLETLYPGLPNARIEQLAIQHPRVTLEESCQQFGRFEFEKSTEVVPDVFAKYEAEFAPYMKEQVLVHG